jgi:hypothetical protein
MADAFDTAWQRMKMSFKAGLADFLLGSGELAELDPRRMRQAQQREALRNFSGSADKSGVPMTGDPGTPEYMLREQAKWDADPNNPKNIARREQAAAKQNAENLKGEASMFTDANAAMESRRRELMRGGGFAFNRSAYESVGAQVGGASRADVGNVQVSELKRINDGIRENTRQLQLVEAAIEALNTESGL